jgi:hypothetical protein
MNGSLPRTVTKAPQGFTIRDANPETRILYNYLTNTQGVTPNMAADMKAIVKENAQKDIFTLQQRVYAYVLNAHILHMRDTLLDKVDANMNKEDLEVQYCVTDLAERAYRNIAWNTLADAIQKFYKEKSNGTY